MGFEYQYMRKATGEHLNDNHKFRCIRPWTKWQKGHPMRTSISTSETPWNSFVVAEMIAVLKANACGHGSVPVARHLYDNGVRHFAVATPLEGVLLRQAGLHGFIQIFGTVT